MIDDQQTIAVQMTPAGRGAVATILVEGPQATAAVEHWFRPATALPLSQRPLNRILYGRWRSETGEELVVCRRGPQRVEVHCHGGAAAPAQILEDLAAVGCQTIDWREQVARDAQDRIQAEAHVALADAPTERTARLLLDQYAGALKRAIDQVDQFVEAGRGQAAQELLTQLLARGPLGLHLTQPWQVVLAGQPNVGKSSLINAILGYQRSIVFDQPGTTRDVITAQTAIDGWPVELSDTAGLRDSHDLLEAAGVERARSQLALADLIVLVFDAGQPWSEADEPLCQAYPRAVVVHNKADRARDESSRPPGLWTSAVTGQGVPELLQIIAQRLVPEAPEPGTPIPFTQRQLEWLEKARDALDAEDFAGCRRNLLGMASKGEA